MERDDLVADEVVACLEALRDGGFEVQFREDLVGAPAGTGEGRGRHAHLVDL